MELRDLFVRKKRCEDCEHQLWFNNDGTIRIRPSLEDVMRCIQCDPNTPYYRIKKIKKKQYPELHCLKCGKLIDGTVYVSYDTNDKALYFCSEKCIKGAFLSKKSYIIVRGDESGK